MLNLRCVCVVGIILLDKDVSKIARATQIENESSPCFFERIIILTFYFNENLLFNSHVSQVDDIHLSKKRKENTDFLYFPNLLLDICLKLEIVLLFSFSPFADLAS